MPGRGDFRSGNCRHGKASILIPFAEAVNDHQTKNAEFMVKAGAAKMIAESELNGKKLTEAIRYMHGQPELIRHMEENAMKLINWNAADDIVEACIALLH
jgi:UDP-N-acetylglucosamine--N-acetylmuramyl-(pentapeptide) pyrophosphoryl-undecaprenol N-acetylglucosamine transferase